MNADPLPAPPAAPPSRPRRKRLLVLAVALVLAYLAAAYLVAPLVWRAYERRHPALAQLPTLTRTGNGIPGDPLNVALIATESELKTAMLEAGWYPADPLTLQSCLAIAVDTVLRRSYDHAPVSNLFLWDRKQDLAFEQPVGNDPRKRHHVRFWRSAEVDDSGRPLWAGAATYDERVGLSHDTGQITHHIGADVDAERDHVVSTLRTAGRLGEVSWIYDFQDPPQGRNGGGDPWHTDGRLALGTVASESR